MAHKSFRKAINADPIWFTIPDRDDNDVRINCVDDLPAGVVFEFIEKTEGDAPGGDEAESGNGKALGAVYDLFNAAVVEEDHDRFWELVNDKRGHVGISMLVDVASWVAGEYTARPTGSSSGSGPSGTPSGQGSTDGVSPTGTTYSKPVLTALST